jgi:hypothetical protein
LKGGVIVNVIKEELGIEKVKEELDASGLSRREAMLQSLVALGAGGALVAGVMGSVAEAFAYDAGVIVACSPDSCATSCLTCNQGCSNGSDK